MYLANSLLIFLLISLSIPDDKYFLKFLFINFLLFDFKDKFLYSIKFFNLSSLLQDVQDF